MDFRVLRAQQHPADDFNDLEVAYPSPLDCRPDELITEITSIHTFAAHDANVLLTMCPEELDISHVDVELKVFPCTKIQFACRAQSPGKPEWARAQFRTRVET